jgi:hypothetical protein
MSDLALTDRPRRGAFNTVSESPDGMVVGIESASIRLNATAFALWELCDGNTSVAEMVLAVCQLFDIGAGQASHDVTESISQMREAGLVT